MVYLIWSIEHQGWWLAARWGYTKNIHEAGRYSETEAKLILEDANRIQVEEVMIHEDCVT